MVGPDVVCLPIGKQVVIMLFYSITYRLVNDTHNTVALNNDSANGLNRVDRYRDLDSSELWVQRLKYALI